VFSVQYGFVRSRQLEGTFPGNPETGVWPITFNRIYWGWGLPPEAAWPYQRVDGRIIWPPSDEPPGIDVLAHQNLGGLYQRVRSLYECKLVLAYHSPLLAVLDITDKWHDPPQGRIPEYDPREVSLGTHSVCLLGYDDAKREIRFVNSWGPDWGDKGFGYISYATFEQTWWEGWRQEFRIKINPTNSEPGLKVRKRGVKEHGGGILHCRDIVGPNEERIAWTFAVQRSDSLDVEELFVKPQYRGRGHGKKLIRELAELANDVGHAPRMWIPDVDVFPDNRAIFEKLVSRLGLNTRQSPVRWAPLVACQSEDDLSSGTLHISDPRPRRPSSAFSLQRAVV
jgi:GNAT superfamily N-acetyltransferase